MHEHIEDFREHIYNLVCGNYELQGASVPESEVVKNAFYEGGDCANAYARVLESYTRLCARLNVPEWDDPDVKIIINELLDIGKCISFNCMTTVHIMGTA